MTYPEIKVAASLQVTSWRLLTSVTIVILPRRPSLIQSSLAGNQSIWEWSLSYE